MKKLAFILLVIFSPVAANATDWCSDNAPKYQPIAERYKKGLFFEVIRCGVEPSYVLGTMHSDDPKLIEMLDYVFPKLVYAKSANFELKFDQETMRKVIDGMNLPQGSIETLQTLVGTSLYTDFTRIMARAKPEMEEQSYYRMKPWAAAVLIQEPPRVADGVALDLKLQAYASQRGIAVHGLETPEEQLGVFDNLPVAKQIEFFRDTVANYETVESENKKMFDVYVSQDLAKLQQMGEEAFKRIADRDFAEKLKLDLIDKRNKGMTKNMMPNINSGGAFIAVGALHLPGQNGVLALLEEKGYYINVVEDPDTKAGAIN